MRPISGHNPYDRAAQSRTRPAAVVPPTALRVVRPDAHPARVAAPTDVEIAVRLFADGTSISVKRATVVDADGTRRTVGIDALIR